MTQIQYTFNGTDQDSIAVDRIEATGEATDLIRAKNVNANASTLGAVKVTMGKGFRFGGAGVRAAEAVAA